MNEDIDSIIYEDLIKKGYNVVSGSKFGTDYIIYKDTVEHSVALICIYNTHSSIPIAYELASLARIAANVKKEGFLAFLIKNEPKYLRVTQKKNDRIGKPIINRNKRAKTIPNHTINTENSDMIIK
ncbi:hypothetical protein WA158_000257 [Blastocystis sp. Blastoise]